MFYYLTGMKIVTCNNADFISSKDTNETDNITYHQDLNNFAKTNLHLKEDRYKVTIFESSLRTLKEGLEVKEEEERKQLGERLLVSTVQAIIKISSPININLIFYNMEG